MAALGLLVDSGIQLLAAAQASFRSVPIGSEHRKARLTIAGFMAVLLSLIVVFLPFSPGFPSLFVNATGVTMINQVIYAVAIGVFLAGSFLFMRLYSRSKSSTLYWYSLVLLLWGICTFGVAWQLRFSDIVAWTGRLGWYFGSLYYLIALRSAQGETNSQWVTYFISSGELIKLFIQLGISDSKNLAVKKLSGDVLAKAWGKAMGTDRKQFDMFFDKMLDGFCLSQNCCRQGGQARWLCFSWC